MLGCKILHSPQMERSFREFGWNIGRAILGIHLPINWSAGKCLEHSGIKAFGMGKLAYPPYPICWLVFVTLFLSAAVTSSRSCTLSGFILLCLLWTQVFPTNPGGQETANCQQQLPSKHHRTLLFVLLFVILAPKLGACYVPKLLPWLGRIYWYNWVVFRPVNYIQWSRYSFLISRILHWPLDGRCPALAKKITSMRSPKQGARQRSIL